MKIAIIGAGFTGLSAALKLLEDKHETVIFEKENLPGGLASGFKKNKWIWPLEKYYHHFFTNDTYVFSLAKEVKQEIIVKRPKTSIFLENSSNQLDSPLSAIKFSKLSFLERLRMATIIGILKYNPVWKPLESTKASVFLPKAMGEIPYGKIWEPQLKNKFGSYADNISLAWFWARIRKRTTCLAYPKGGFLTFANNIENKIIKRGGEIKTNTDVVNIKSENKKLAIYYKKDGKQKKESFEKVLITVNPGLFTRMASELPSKYKNKLNQLKSIGAINLVLRLKKQFLTDNTYWLSICESNSSMVAVVEHTNFIDKKYYNNEHLLYVGSYLDLNHELYRMNASQILDKYTPFLQKINPSFRQSIIDYDLFKDPFAQPVVPINYSKILPTFETPLKNLYLASMHQVYPWDRGTNYAIELGGKAVEIIYKS